MGTSVRSLHCYPAKSFEKKSRVWSNAMMTITNPRKVSTDSSRGRPEPESAGSDISGARLPVWGVDGTTSHYHNGSVPSDDFSDLACRFGSVKRSVSPLPRWPRSHTHRSMHGKPPFLYPHALGP